MRSGARIEMEALVREGVDTIFGYPGGVVLPHYDEMPNWPRVRHILVRHEQCGAHMADGYARATGEVGVCFATSGPGATNLDHRIAAHSKPAVGCKKLPVQNPKTVIRCWRGDLHATGNG